MTIGPRCMPPSTMTVLPRGAASSRACRRGAEPTRRPCRAHGDAGEQMAIAAAGVRWRSAPRAARLIAWRRAQPSAQHAAQRGRKQADDAPRIIARGHEVAHRGRPDDERRERLETYRRRADSGCGRTCRAATAGRRGSPIGMAAAAMTPAGAAHRVQQATAGTDTTSGRCRSETAPSRAPAPRSGGMPM